MTILQDTSDIVEGEGAVAIALHVPPLGQPRPREKVGVVLDHCGDDDIVRSTPPPAP